MESKFYLSVIAVFIFGTACGSIAQETKQPDASTADTTQKANTFENRDEAVQELDEALAEEDEAVDEESEEDGRSSTEADPPIAEPEATHVVSKIALDTVDEEQTVIEEVMTTSNHSERKIRQIRSREELRLVPKAALPKKVIEETPLPTRIQPPLPAGPDPYAEQNERRTRDNMRRNAKIGPPHPDLTHPVDKMKVLRGFDGSKCRHQAIDIFSSNKYFGIGKPVYAITRSKVVFIGTPEEDPARFGRLDQRPGMETRIGVKIPRQMRVAGYGRVFPFTHDWGRSRTGVFIVTRGLGGVFHKHRIRYMHLAAPHPKLHVGQIVERGQEIGIQGSTAILNSVPHLHLDVEGTDGRYLDSAPFLGLEKLAPSECSPMNIKEIRAKARARRSGRYTRTHKVKRGESLWRIARKYGVSVKMVRKANRMRTNHIKPGQSLKIPAAAVKMTPRTKANAYGGAKQLRRTKGKKRKARSGSYIVKNGDSLWSIAQKFNTTVGRLRSANRLRGTSIRPGMSLIIPRAKLSKRKPKSKRRAKKSRGRRTYKVRSGDSLWKIARKFGVRVHALRKANRIRGQQLRPGQVLFIP